jgi:hypothetical protein
VGPNDYVGRWTYKNDKSGPPLEGDLFWKENDPKPVLFPPDPPLGWQSGYGPPTPAPGLVGPQPPASNQGVMLSMPPPTAGEYILQGQQGK